MDETIFREISSQVAKDIEQKVKQSIQSGGCAKDGDSESKDPGLRAQDFGMESEIRQEIFEKISSEVSATIAQKIASKIAASMGSDSQNAPAVKSKSSKANEKVHAVFSKEIDGLVSGLEGSISVILDLVAEEAIQGDQAKKKLMQLKSKFRADLDDLMQKRNWKMDFLKS